MVLLNIKSVLFLTALSQSVLSSTIKNPCGKIPAEAAEDVNTISKELKISTCEALDVYNYVVTGEKLFKDALPLEVNVNFNEHECKKKCKSSDKTLNKEFKTLKKIKEKFITLLGFDYYKSCEDNCHLASLDAEVLRKEGTAEKVLDSTKSKINSLLGKKDKRDKPCDPVSQGIINKSPTTPYQYGFYRYTQGAGSAQTAISVVNGCGPKNNAQVSQIVGSLPYAEDFRPACNSHDICVTCHQLPRSGCDSQFKTNLKSLCSTMYQINSGDNFFVKSKKTIQEADCSLTASLFADAVSLFGENAYQDTPVNTSPNCAACGVPVVRDTLYKTPFYVLK